MPISQSAKPSTQARPITFTWNDFSGGLNADNAGYPLALADNELSDVLNYKYVRQGNLVKLVSRDGLTKANTTGAGAAINDYYNFVTSTGTAYDVVAANNDLQYLSSGAFTKIGDLSSNRGRMCQLNNKLVIADGGTLKYWDGTTFSFFNDSGILLLDSLSSTSTGSLALYNTSNIRFAQKYTATANVSFVGTMTFVLMAIGTPPGTCVAKIIDNDGTTLLATSDAINASAINTVAEAQKVFTFTTSTNLVSGNTYYLTFEYDNAGSDVSNCIKVYFAGNVIAGNAAYRGSGGGWTENAAVDCMISFTGSAPLSTFAITKKNRIYCNHTTYPNRLYYCNANDPNDWSTVNGAGYLIFDGHYKINGAYAYDNCIFVFADNPKAIYKLTGDSPDEYSIADDPWRGVTAISQDVIQDVGSDLIFQDTRGIVSLRSLAQTGDIEKSIISKNKVSKTYVLPDWVCSGGYSVPCTPISGKVITDTQYIFTNWHSEYAIIYDQENGNWTRYQLGLGGAVPTCFGTNAGLTYIGDSDGNLWYFDYTKDQDNSVDFSLIAKTNWNDLGVLFDKDARFVDSVLISANQETYDLELYVNLNTVTPKKTLSLVSLSQNGAFQSPYCGNLNEVNFNFKQIQAKVTSVSSGTGPHWLDRIVLEASILSHF